VCLEGYIIIGRNPRTIRKNCRVLNHQIIGNIKKMHIFCFNLMSNFPFIHHRPELVVKKLRYYARFIVVCLLLNKMDVVKDLVKVRVSVYFLFVFFFFFWVLIIKRGIQ
jgi:hypothetical protein